MRVFVFMEETGGGKARRRREDDDSFEAFINECIADDELMDGMTFGRWLPDQDDPDWERPALMLRSLDVGEIQENWNGYADDNPGKMAPTIVHVKEDEELVIQFYEMEVPDWTRFIFNGACHPTSEGYCGIGGGGYVEVET